MGAGIQKFMNKTNHTDLKRRGQLSEDIYHVLTEYVSTVYAMKIRNKIMEKIEGYEIRNHTSEEL